MAHDITATDGMVLTGKPAWHGLGRIVEEAPTPREALDLARLNWTVEQWPLYSLNADAGIRQAVETHVLNVRSDTKEQLGVVGAGWVPIQNAELADFATALAGDSGDAVRVESAASIQGGKRVWFLLRGESFSPKGHNDPVHPYILLANGHDGSLALHVRPTSIRVVCRNTLNMALGAKSAINVRIRHEGNLAAKLSEVRRVLGLFDKQRKDFIERVELLSARKMSREDLQRFFVEVYEKAFEPVPQNPATDAGKRKLRQAQEAIYGFGREWDKERGRVGETAWAALNSVTAWVQHVDHVRGKDQRARNENRLKSNLFGTIAERTDTAAKLALAMV